MSSSDGETLAHSTLTQQIAALTEIVRFNPVVCSVLDQADDLGLRSCYLGAGAVTQGVEPPPRLRADSRSRRLRLGVLRRRRPQRNEREGARSEAAGLIDTGKAKLDLTNEARVHTWYERRFGHPLAPYRSVEHAIATWPSTATSVGIRAESGGLAVCAPFGLTDLFNMVVRLNMTLVKRAVYEAKVERWRRLWPRLSVLPWP